MKYEACFTLDDSFFGSYWEVSPFYIRCVTDFLLYIRDISLFQGLVFTVFLIGVFQFGLGQCGVWTQFDVWTQAK